MLKRAVNNKMLILLYIFMKVMIIHNYTKINIWGIVTKC